MQPKKIILLASDCESTRWLYHALAGIVHVEGVILEQPISKKELAKNRIKKIGLMPVIGQALFSALIVPLLKLQSKKRKAFLVNKYRLNNNDISSSKTCRVSSVNDEASLKAISLFQPDIIVVNGTRIISKKILQSTNALFVNMHVGITPNYRGSHGGYWALRNKDAANFGTTIHLVDAGIDTGAVINQVFIKPDRSDNFATYPVLQAAVGIDAFKKVLVNIIAGNYETIKHTEKGNLYFQPTLWQYLTGGVR
ncbi:MAG: formyl transferase [Chitinophagaceae bacterium]|nr:formyl transferase [Chitinophagaceae bacterium]